MAIPRSLHSFLKYVGTNSLFQFVGTGIKLLEKAFGSYAVLFGAVHYFTLTLGTNVLELTGRLLVVYTQ